MMRQGLALFLIIFTMSVQASQSMDFSAESYHWREYSSGGFRFLTESGPRYSLGLSSTHYDELSATHSSIRYYLGDVHYDGYLQDQSGNLIAPYQSTTGYSGFNLQQTYLSYASERMLDYGELGFGMDVWGRILDKGGSAGYTENYLTLYLRAGLGLGRSDRGWHSGLGLKYPFLVNETVYVNGTDPIHLSPKPQFSAYAEIGYSARTWQLALFYDGYNLDVSPVVATTSGGVPTGQAVLQPRSVTDRLGLRLSYFY